MQGAAPVAVYADLFHNIAELFIIPTAMANSTNTQPVSSHGDGKVGRASIMNANDGAIITPMLTPAE